MYTAKQEWDSEDSGLDPAASVPTEADSSPSRDLNSNHRLASESMKRLAKAAHWQPEAGPAGALYASPSSWKDSESSAMMAAWAAAAESMKAAAAATKAARRAEHTHIPPAATGGMCVCGGGGGEEGRRRRRRR